MQACFLYLTRTWYKPSIKRLIVLLVISNLLSAFFGGGLRFGDDDVKYLLSGLSGAAFGGGNGASFSGSGVTSINCGQIGAMIYLWNNY